MRTAQRAVLSISVPQAIATEYRKIALAQGETVSQLFREMFAFYRSERIKKDYYQIQEYGFQQAQKQNITEEMIEALVFEGR